MNFRFYIAGFSSIILKPSILIGGLVITYNLHLSFFQNITSIRYRCDVLKKIDVKNKMKLYTLWYESPKGLNVNSRRWNRRLNSLNVDNPERVELKYSNIERHFDSSILSGLETTDIFYRRFHRRLFTFIPFRDFSIFITKYIILKQNSQFSINSEHVTNLNSPNFGHLVAFNVLQTSKKKATITFLRAIIALYKLTISKDFIFSVFSSAS